jgi:plasmid replication initiation protein
MNKKEIEKDRWKHVTKRNDIVQKARYSLDIRQQKTIMFLCSKIDSINDKELKDITVDLKELCQVMNIDSRAGKNIGDLKNALQKLYEKSLWVNLGNGKSTLMSWLSRVTIDEGTCKVVVRFDELMAPYLIKIKGRFLQYNLINVLPMKSQYSLRLYELIKSYCWKGDWKVKVYELRELLLLENNTYVEFKEFKRSVLDRAINEINSFTDIQVAFDTTRTNRVITGIRFVMVDHLSAEDRSRRIVNQSVGLGDIPGGKISSPKKLTVKDIEILQKIKKTAGEMKKLAEKFPSAQSIDFGEEIQFMPGQTTIDDLI